MIRDDISDADREKALQLMYEIIRQSKGGLQGKARLFKAFYLANLIHAHNAPVCLCDWPIVKMPNGPGIHEFPALIAELVDRGWVEQRDIQIGPYPSTEFRVVREDVATTFSETEKESIRGAVEYVRSKTASELSDETHEFSRTWQESDIGAALDVYVDLIRETEFQKREQAIEELKKIFR